MRGMQVMGGDHVGQGRRRTKPLRSCTCDDSVAAVYYGAGYYGCAVAAQYDRNAVARRYAPHI